MPPLTAIALICPRRELQLLALSDRPLSNLQKVMMCLGCRLLMQVDRVLAEGPRPSCRCLQRNTHTTMDPSRSEVAAVEESKVDSSSLVLYQQDYLSLICKFLETSDVLLTIVTLFISQKLSKLAKSEKTDSSSVVPANQFLKFIITLPEPPVV